MLRFSRFVARLVRGERDRQHGRLVNPYGWLRRNWIVSSIVVLVLLAGALVWELTASPCGRGLVAVGTPHVCVGLDLDSTGFADSDALADLERSLAQQNSTVIDPFATIVLLDDMTPNPRNDSDDLESLKHRVQGAMAAAWRANNQAVAGGTSPNIKLLLANYGSRAEYWHQAVDAIKQANPNEHIVAVTGIGQSLDTTREAVAALSAAGIATVGSVITADNMNYDLTGQHIQNFVRVAPTNTDEAQVAALYLTNHAYQKIMLIQDTNQQDNYAQTLASAFVAAYESQHKTKVKYTELYRSPDDILNGANRDEYMMNQFARMHSDICAIEPDLIYFAGRGVDLGSFMRALSQSGACLVRPLEVMTGDDASSLVGKELPSSDHLSFKVFYTALAHGDQWNKIPPDSDNRKNYDEFAKAFTENGFTLADLTDGQAMMSHDAVLVATTAARQNPLATTNPSTVSAYFLRFRCEGSIPGASGTIAFNDKGNPIDKAMPILQIQPDGSVTQEDLVWPTGSPFDPSAICQ